MLAIQQLFAFQEFSLLKIYYLVCTLEQAVAIKILKTIFYFDYRNGGATQLNSISTLL